MTTVREDNPNYIIVSISNMVGITRVAHIILFASMFIGSVRDKREVCCRSIQIFSIVYQHIRRKNTRDDIHFIQQNSVYFQHIIVRYITHHLTSNIIPFLYSNCLKLFALSLLTLFYYILCFDVRYASFHFQWVSVRVWRVISILAW
eukprot:505038_1